MRRHTSHINVSVRYAQVDESKLLCYTKLSPGAKKSQRKNSKKLHFEW